MGGASLAGSSDPMSFLKGIDVNRTPASAAAAEEDEAGVSSPNSTISSLSGKRSERDVTVCEDIEMERACSLGGGGGGGGSGASQLCVHLYNLD